MPVSVLIFIVCGKYGNQLVPVFQSCSFFPLTVERFCFPYTFKTQLSTFINYLDIILIVVALGIYKKLEELTTVEF